MLSNPIKLPKLPKLPTIRGKSAWTFGTSSTFGVTVELAAQGGWIRLYDPNKSEVTFRFGGVGVGFGSPFKLPRFGPINLKRSSNVAPSDFTNLGSLFVLDTCPHDDFSPHDIQGLCLIMEAGIAVIEGWAGAVTMFGMDPKPLIMYMATHSPPAPLPILPPPTADGLLEQVVGLINSATGILLMTGHNVGFQASAGGSIYLGRIW